MLVPSSVFLSVGLSVLSLKLSVCVWACRIEAAGGLQVTKLCLSSHLFSKHAKRFVCLMGLYVCTNICVDASVCHLCVHVCACTCVNVYVFAFVRVTLHVCICVCAHAHNSWICPYMPYNPIQTSRGVHRFTPKSWVVVGFLPHPWHPPALHPPLVMPAPMHMPYRRTATTLRDKLLQVKGTCQDNPHVTSWDTTISMSCYQTHQLDPTPPHPLKTRPYTFTPYKKMPRCHHHFCVAKERHRKGLRYSVKATHTIHIIHNTWHLLSNLRIANSQWSMHRLNHHQSNLTVNSPYYVPFPKTGHCLANLGNNRFFA